MSDYYPAKITIGGTLRRNLFDALMEVLEAEELPRPITDTNQRGRALCPSFH